MRLKSSVLFIVSLILLLFVACASKPVLYPNNKYKRQGEEKSNKDVEQCMNDSEAYLKGSKGKQVAKHAGFGAVVGGAMGAVAGAFSGDLAKGAFQGAAVGGAGGAAVGALSPDEIKRRYVNKCLQDKGYEVIGWD